MAAPNSGHSEISRSLVDSSSLDSPRGDLHGDDLSVVGDHEALGHVGPPVGPDSGQAPAVTPHLLDIVDIVE